MGRTVRAWQKRSGWKDNRHREAKKRHYGEKKDRFRFDTRDYR